MFECASHKDSHAAEDARRARVQTRAGGQPSTEVMRRAVLFLSLPSEQTPGDAVLRPPTAITRIALGGVYAQGKTGSTMAEGSLPLAASRLNWRAGVSWHGGQRSQMAID
jgi:hypothetical protein